MSFASNRSPLQTKSSKEKGKEFESSKKVEERYKLQKPGINMVITWGYIIYTRSQEKGTPQLQAMLLRLRDKYGNEIPEDVREDLRKESRKIMPLVDSNTFNGRSAILFTAVLFNIPWLYFFWEIIVLNVIKYIIKSRHERFCSKVAV